MKIPVILNGKKTILDANPEEKLVNILREKKLFSVKKGCGKGHCGFCTILLDKKPVSSCLIPAGIVRNCEIETLEYFAQSENYEDIIKGFEQAGVHLCGYCNAARIFTVHDLLEKVYRPSKEELFDLADGQTCSCTNRDTFINGVLYATANKHRREGRKNGIK